MIKILTSPIHHKISGGNIYNDKLFAFLKSNNLDVAFEIIDHLNDYPFEKNKKYIIDGILIGNDTDIDALKNYKIIFLIHFWSSKYATNSNIIRSKLLEVEIQICNNFSVIVTGKPSLLHIEDELKPTQKNYLLVEPAIDSKWEKKTDFRKLPRKIVYLSNFIEGKGHFKLIQVVQELQQLDFTVDCYGEILSDPYFLEFNAKIASLNLKNLSYKGKRSHAEINKLLLGYDLLLHFSDYEAFGMSTLEALAANVPFVVSPTGNHEGYKKKEILGILNTFEADEMTSYLSEIVQSEKMYKAHIESLSNFNVPTWEDNFSPILKNILEL